MCTHGMIACHGLHGFCLLGRIARPVQNVFNPMSDPFMRHLLQVDIIAGLSVGAMVVPQGMSYAKLAGLPQVRYQ